MLLFIILLILFSIIFLIGHKGLPEKIKSSDYQLKPEAADIMKGAEPIYEEGDGKKCVLMVHGFEGSPFTLKTLAKILNEQGYTVIAPLLPGHGTNVKEFSKTRYEHWYQAIKNIYVKERPRYETFFVLGFSMGGNLSLKLTAEFNANTPPTGLILISTPVYLNGFINGRIYLKDWRLMLSGIIQYIVPFIKKGNQKKEANLLNPWVGYTDAYASRCVHSFKINLPKVRKQLGLIRCPTCMIQATNDRTIPTDNLYYILSKVNSYEKRSFLFSINENISTRHVLITHEETQSKVFHYIIKFMKDTLINFDLKPLIKKEKKPWWRVFFNK